MKITPGNQAHYMLGKLLVQLKYLLDLPEAIRINMPALDELVDQLAQQFRSAIEKLRLTPCPSLEFIQRNTEDSLLLNISSKIRESSSQKIFKISVLLSRGKCILLGKTDVSPEIWQASISNLKHHIDSHSLLSTLQLVEIESSVLADISQNIQEFLHGSDLSKLSGQWNSLVEKIEKVLFAKNRVSELDPSKVVSDTTWAVSLVRNLHSDYPEHVFLVIEGNEESNAKIWFIDFVMTRQNVRLGKIRCDSKERPWGTKLLFTCTLPLLEIKETDQLLSMTWLCAKEIALRLIARVVEKMRQMKADPSRVIYFNQFPPPAAYASLLYNESNEHRCFTWASHQLRNSDPAHSAWLPVNPQQWLALSPNDRDFLAPYFNPPKWYQRRYAHWAIATGITAGLTYIAATAVGNCHVQ